MSKAGGVQEAAGHHRNAALYLIGALLQGLGVVFVQPFAIRVLNDDRQWGELILAVSVVQVGVVLAAAGLPLAITRAWFDGGDGPSRARSISGFLSIAGICLGLTAALALWVVQTISHAPVPIAFICALLAMGILATVLASQAILRAQERPVAFVCLSIGSSVGAHFCGLAAIWLFQPLAWVYLAGFTIAVALTAVVALRTAPPALPGAAPGAVREGFAIGLPVLPHTGALMLLTQGAVFLLAFLVGTVQSGDYGKVQVFILGTITLLGALNNAWVPRIMSATREERPRRVRETMSVASYAALGVVILASGGANVLTHVLADGRSDLIPVAQVMPLAAFGYVLYLNTTTLLFSDKRTSVLAIVTPVVLVVSVALAFLPASGGNLVLLAAVNAGSFSILGIVYWVIVRAGAPGGWPVRRYLVCLALGAIYVLVLLLLPRDLVAGVLTCVAVAVLGGLALLIAWRRGMLTASNS